MEKLYVIAIIAALSMSLIACEKKEVAQNEDVVISTEIKETEDSEMLIATETATKTETETETKTETETEIEGEVYIDKSKCGIPVKAETTIYPTGSTRYDECDACGHTVYQKSVNSDGTVMLEIKTELEIEDGRLVKQHMKNLLTSTTYTIRYEYEDIDEVVLICTSYEEETNQHLSTDRYVNGKLDKSISYGHNGEVCARMTYENVDGEKKRTFEIYDFIEGKYRIVDETVSTNYKYDKLGRLISYEDNGLSYEYVINGEVVEQKVTNKETEFCQMKYYELENGEKVEHYLNGELVRTVITTILQ